MKPKKTSKPTPSNVVISHCNFQGVVWEKEALEAINNVAKGLKNLTELFKGQHITVGPLLQVGPREV